MTESLPPVPTREGGDEEAAAAVAGVVVGRAVHAAIAHVGPCRGDDGAGAAEDQAEAEAAPRAWHDAPVPPRPLEERTVRGCLSGLGPVADGTRQALLKLDCEGLALTSVEVLELFPWVQEVDVSDNHLESLEALGAMPALLHLDAARNRLGSCLGFAPPRSLRTADLSENRLRTLGDLSAHPDLTHLYVDDNAVRELAGLAGCRKLRELSAAGNELGAISGLEGLPLRRLVLRENRIARITGLETLRRLRILDLSHNRLVSLEGLQHLHAVQSVLLAGNRVAEVAETRHVRHLGMLTDLDLRGNPVGTTPDYRLAVVFRLPGLCYLDGAALTPEEKVAATDLFDPPPEVVAAIDHVMHLTCRVVQPPAVLQMTTADPERPYPLLVLCGPAGCGKRQLRSRLVAEQPLFAECPSHTSRAPVEGEVDGLDYHFVEHAVLEDLLQRGQLVQTCRVHDELYAISTPALEAIAAARRIPVLTLEVEGVFGLKKSHLRPIYVYVRGAGGDDAAPAARRARYEECAGRDGFFDAVIEGADEDAAYAALGPVASRAAAAHAATWDAEAERFRSP